LSAPEPEPGRDRVIDVGDLVAADIGTVGALAWIVLDARRRGERVRLIGASAELRALVELSGLTRVLRPEPGGSIEPGR
jgi:ABC-type transporter Mla MlaB component